jgi:hypothetical protein
VVKRERRGATGRQTLLDCSNLDFEDLLRRGAEQATGQVYRYLSNTGEKPVHWGRLIGYP